MGKWNNRFPRRNSRYNRQNGYPPKFYSLQAPLPDVSQDGVPLWEKKFCVSIGSVPWQKIIDSKELIHYNSHVLNWDDSAAWEAFQTSKRHYWEMINHIPSDIVVPDPDMYTDDVDWNSYIDPELIKELNQAYFAPPEDDENNDTNNKRAKYSPNVPSEVNGWSPDDSERNPWEFNNLESRGSLLNKAQGWHQLNDGVDGSRHLEEADNPWECTAANGNGRLMDNAWGDSEDKLQGWNQLSNHVESSGCWDEGGNYREWGVQGGVSVKGRGWEKSGDRCWDWNQRDLNDFVGRDRHWSNRYSQNNGVPQGRDCRNNRENEDGWKQQEHCSNVGAWRSCNKSWENRIGSYHQTSSYNSSTIHRNDHQTGRGWRKENARKCNC